MRALTLLLIITLALTATGAPRAAAQDDAPQLPEQPVIEIALSGPMAQPFAEISGLAWYGDTLLLLAENPNDFAEGDEAGRFFALEKNAILAYLDADDPAPLEPRPVPVYAPDIRRALPGFDGFEAAVFVDNRVFLTVEVFPNRDETFGMVVGGEVTGDLDAITLDLAQTVTLPAQTAYTNLSYEALLAVDGGLIAIYEVNGAGVNAEPVAYAVDLARGTLTPLPMVALDYRVTDATAPGEDGVFWVANYFFPLETHLRPDSDPLIDRYGTGATHARLPQIERLVALRVDPSAGITRPDQPPTYLELAGILIRNWEGIARLDDRGLLVVTDKYPQTILAFVALDGLR